jgi:hypothetical protein
MENNHSEFLLNARTLRLVIYSSLVIGNLLFILLYPAHVQIGVIGVLFFFAVLIWSLWKDLSHTATKISDTSPSKKSIH